MNSDTGAKRPFPHTLALGLGCLLLTLGVYGAALRFPFFFDDLLEMPYVANHSYRELWTHAQLAYYRPLNFHLWKMLHDLVGAHSRFLTHALNLLLHAGNGWLVGWLAGQWWPPRRPLRSAISATLFLLFPFSYQGVPWISALPHILVTSLILLSLATFWRWRRGDGRRWAVLSLLAAALAPFAHENGLLVGPLVVLVTLTESSFRIPKPVSRFPKTLPRSSTSPLTDYGLPITGLKDMLIALLWGVPGLLWLPLRFLIPNAESDGFFVNGLEGIWQSSVYFLQGVAYPLTWAGDSIQDWLGVADLTAVLFTAVPALLLALLLQTRTRRALLPWGWLLITLLPAIMFLRFNYVINGPRLMMLTSAGIAWLWSDALLNLAGEHRWRQAASALLLLALLVQNLAFVSERMRLHRVLAGAFDEAIDAATTANAAGDGVAILNFPSWLAPEPAYAVGHEGVLFWADYVPHSALTTAHTGEPADLVLARVDAIRPQIPYYYGVTGVPPDWEALRQRPVQVLAARYTETAVSLRHVGSLGSQPAAAPLITFTKDKTPFLHLTAAGTATAGATTAVTLTWQLVQPLSDATVFVHLLDAGGQLIAQADGDPLAGAYPFTVWQPGEIVTDVRYAQSDAPPAQVLVGLYDRVTGERLTTVLPAGTALPDNAYVIGPNK